MALKGLIIREPWIGEILAGRKTWELRSTPFRYRGELALIRQGSGLVVGMANLADCLAPQSKQELQASALLHRWPVDKLDELIAKNWLIPWVLNDVRPLRHPVRYVHRSGAVKTVTIDEQAEREIRQQLLGLHSKAPVRATQHQRLSAETPPPTPLALSTHSGAERAQRMHQLPHFSEKSVHSITDADRPRLRLPVEPFAEETPAASIMDTATVGTPTRPGQRTSLKEQVPILRKIIGVTAALVTATCFLGWIGQIGSGLVHALFTWDGLRWLIWTMAAWVIVCATILDSSSDPTSSSTRRPK